MIFLNISIKLSLKNKQVVQPNRTITFKNIEMNNQLYLIKKTFNPIAFQLLISQTQFLFQDNFLLFIQLHNYNFNQLFDLLKILQHNNLMSSTISPANFLIDQQIEVSKNYLVQNFLNTHPNYLDQLSQIIKQKNPLINNAKAQGSYQVILQQSLTTQDKPFLYQILIENQSSIIKSSLQNLSPKRVIQLLRMIRSLLQQHIKLGKGQDHCQSIGLWLQQLIRLHLTTIVSNVENKETIVSIRKFLAKKTQRKQQLKMIKTHLLSEQSALQLQQLKQKNNQRKNPKFQYIEQEKQILQEDQQQIKQQSQIHDQDMEGLNLEDLDMNEFMDDDL